MDNSRPQGANDETPPNRRRGFSLLEIMAVVVIIGMLTGLVGLNVVDRLDQSRVATTKTKLVQLENALEMYKIDNSRYPTSEQGLEALMTKPEVGKIPTGWQGPYLNANSVPSDGWNNPFLYISDGRDKTIISLGADGIEGGTDLDADIVNKDF